MTPIALEPPLSREELFAKAKAWDLKLPASLKTPELEQAVKKEAFKRQARIEAEANAELRAEAQKTLGIDPNATTKPNPETVAAEKSERVYAKFHNQEDLPKPGEPGVAIQFDYGPKHKFKLYHGKVHVIPRVLCDPDYAESEFGNRTLSLVERCVLPVYENRKNAEGDPVSVQSGTTPRFLFTEVKPAPQDAPFGVVL